MQTIATLLSLNSPISKMGTISVLQGFSKDCIIADNVLKRS